MNEKMKILLKIVIFFINILLKYILYIPGISCLENGRRATPIHPDSPPSL